MKAVKKLLDKPQLTKCPFHEEKTPSCSIDWKKKTFHCFGCGVDGTLSKKTAQSYEFVVNE